MGKIQSLKSRIKAYAISVAGDKKKRIIAVATIGIILMCLAVGTVYALSSKTINSDETPASYPITESCKVDDKTYSSGESFNKDGECCKCNDGKEACSTCPAEKGYSPVKLVGTCGSDGSAHEYYKKEPCKIVDIATGKTLKEVGYIGKDKNVIGYQVYSGLFLGKYENGKQYFIMSGAEGGGEWIYIYSLDIKTRTSKLVAETHFVYDELPQNAFRKSAIVSYPVSYPSNYPTNGAVSGCDNNYRDNCSFYLEKKDEADCKDASTERYYSSSCYQNWNEQSEYSKWLNGKKLADFKPVGLRFMKILKDYKIFYYRSMVVDNCSVIDKSYYVGSCTLRLIPKDKSECTDLNNPKAYQAECFTNWNEQTETQKVNTLEKLSSAASRK